MLFFEAQAGPDFPYPVHKAFNRKTPPSRFGERFGSICVDIHVDAQLTDFDVRALPSFCIYRSSPIVFHPVMAFGGLDGNKM